MRHNHTNQCMKAISQHTITPMQFGAFSPNGTGRCGQDGFKTKKRAVNTDLQSAFDQIEGNHSRVCGATAQNPTKATQDEILL